MAEDELAFWFIPSLIAVLLRREQEAGRPLTEQEVLCIRDDANVVMTPIELVPQLEKERGYRDIDPENCWREWQVARKELG
jgi:hypothetical protein